MKIDLVERLGSYIKIPSLRRVLTQDFPAEYKDFVEKLSGSLNINLQVLYDVLNRRVSQADNIDCVIRDVEVIVDSSGIPTSTTTFSLDDKTRPIQGISVQRAENLTNAGIYPTSGVFITFGQVQTGVQIQHVTGLPTGNKFRLRIVGYY